MWTFPVTVIEEWKALIKKASKSECETIKGYVRRLIKEDLIKRGLL